MIEGDSSRWFPKFYSDNLVLEIGIKDSCLYLILDTISEAGLHIQERTNYC